MKKKFLWSAILHVALSGHTQKIAHADHSLSWLDELHLKTGYVSTRLAWLTGAPSLHVNSSSIITSSNHRTQGRGQKKLMTEAMSMEDL